MKSTSSCPPPGMNIAWLLIVSCWWMFSPRNVLLHIYHEPIKPILWIQSRRCHRSQGYMLCPRETQSKVWTTRQQQQSLGRLFHFTLGEQHFHWSRFLAKWAKKMHRTGSVIPIVHTSRGECLSSTTVNMLVKLVWELPWGGVSKMVGSALFVKRRQVQMEQRWF